MIGLIFLITAFFGFHASHIQIDPDFYSIFPQQNDRVEMLLEETGIADCMEMHLYLSVETDGDVTLEQLRLLNDVVTQIEDHPEVESSITPFNFITFIKNGSRLSVEPIAKGIPETEDDAAIFMDRLLSEPLADGFITAKDGRVLSALFVTDNTADPAVFTADFEEIIAPLNDCFTVYYSGDLPFSEATAAHLQKDLVRLLILAVIVILLVLFLSFGMLRAVVLPLLTVGVGAVWSVGFASLLGFKLTVVSVVLPTIVLAIGSSYTVHILSEYFREFGASGDGNDVKTEMSLAVSHVMKTVILAGLTTIIGFCSLLTTSITPVREFGLSVSFGILSCVVLSLFFLPSLLSKLSPPHVKHRHRIRTGALNRLIGSIGRSVMRFYPIYIIVFFASIAAAIIMYPDISRKVDYMDYFPPEDKIVSDARVIVDNSGGGQSLNITLKAPEGSEKYFLQKDVVKSIVQLQDAVSADEDVLDLMSFYTILEQINGVMYGKPGLPESQGLIMLLSRYFKLMGDRDITYSADAEFVNSDYSQVTLFLKVYDGATGRVLADEDIKKLIDEVASMIDEYGPETEASFIWGNTVIFYEAGKQVQHDQLFSTLLSMLMIVLVSSIFFRSVYTGLLTLIPLVFAIALNYIMMVILSIPLDVTTVLVSNVAIGVGVDDAIHFLLQYKNRLSMNINSRDEAIFDTFRITGRPIVLTTVSIVAGFSILCFASFKPILYFGLLVSISLTAAMLSTLLFLPAFLAAGNRLKTFFIKS